MITIKNKRLRESYVKIQQFLMSQSEENRREILNAIEYLIKRAYKEGKESNENSTSSK